jgi:hypothetical protein
MIPENFFGSFSVPLWNTALEFSGLAEVQFDLNESLSIFAGWQIERPSKTPLVSTNDCTSRNPSLEFGFEFDVVRNL